MKPLRVTDALLREWPLPDAEAIHGKEERGRVLIIGGSTRIPGAAMLAATASPRAPARCTWRRVEAAMAAIAMPEAEAANASMRAGAMREWGKRWSQRRARMRMRLRGPGWTDAGHAARGRR